jgi:meso-butanediol dehydrogenase/(S,S)-butanediol dehydrogenase/diacetyl reductase
MNAERVLLVTGGGSGIGAAVACRAADEGWTAVITGRRAEALQRVALASPNIVPMPADVTDPEAVRDLVASIAERFGRLDAVVANAGAMFTGSVAETSIADWNAALSINLTAAFILAHEAIPYLRTSRGSFVGIGSVAGLRAPPAATAYAVSKAALGMLIQTIAVDEARHGVRANCVNPGWVRTEMSDAEMEEFGASVGLDPERAYAAVTALVPQGRPAEASEIAGAVLWLIGSDSSYVNGAGITVDGGTTIIDPGSVPFHFEVTRRIVHP